MPLIDAWNCDSSTSSEKDYGERVWGFLFFGTRDESKKKDSVSHPSWPVTWRPSLPSRPIGRCWAEESGRSQYRKRRRLRVVVVVVFLTVIAGFGQQWPRQAATLFPPTFSSLSLSLWCLLLHLLTLYQSETRRDATARRSTRQRVERI